MTVFLTFVGALALLFAIYRSGRRDRQEPGHVEYVNPVTLRPLRRRDVERLAEPLRLREVVAAHGAVRAVTHVTTDGEEIEFPVGPEWPVDDILDTLAEIDRL